MVAVYQGQHMMLLDSTWELQPWAPWCVIQGIKNATVCAHFEEEQAQTIVCYSDWDSGIIL